IWRSPLLPYTTLFRSGKLISNDYLDYRGYDDIVINSIFFNINKPQNNGYLVTNEVEEKATKSDLEVFYEKYIKSNSDYYFFYPRSEEHTSELQSRENL